MQRQQRLVARPDHQRVGVLDVDLGGDELAQDVVEFFRPARQLGDDETGFAEREAGLVQRLAAVIGIVHHHADNGRVGRVHHRQPADMDSGLAEGAGQFQKHADLVLQKHGELPHQRLPDRLGCWFCG